MYIADQGNCCIRKVLVTTGIISLVAGTGTCDYSGDNGAATSATLNYPWAVAVDSSGRQYHWSVLFLVSLFSTSLIPGNVYIADYQNHRIRKVTVSTGIISTIAGSSTIGSFSGDGGQATSATLNFPQRVALDTSGRNQCISSCLSVTLYYSRQRVHR